MFELEVVCVIDKSFDRQEDSKHISRFKVFVKLPDGSSAWVMAKKSYEVGSKIKLGLKANPYKDYEDQLLFYVVE